MAPTWPGLSRVLSHGAVPNLGAPNCFMDHLRIGCGGALFGGYHAPRPQAASFYGSRQSDRRVLGATLRRACGHAHAYPVFHDQQWPLHVLAYYRYARHWRPVGKHTRSCFYFLAYRCGAICALGADDRFPASCLAAKAPAHRAAG